LAYVASLGVVIAAICFYMLDRWSMELVSVGVIAALLVLFTIPGAYGADGAPIRAPTYWRGSATRP
jgi:hypothetical protein